MNNGETRWRYWVQLPRVWLRLFSVVWGFKQFPRQLRCCCLNYFVLEVACYVFVRLATLLLFTLRCVAGPHPSLIPSANIRLSHLSRASTMDIVGDLLRKVGVRFLLQALPFVISLLSYKLVHLNRRNSSKNTGVWVLEIKIIHKFYLTQTLTRVFEKSSTEWRQKANKWLNQCPHCSNVLDPRYLDSNFIVVEQYRY